MVLTALPVTLVFWTVCMLWRRLNQLCAHHLAMTRNITARLQPQQCSVARYRLWGDFHDTLWLALVGTRASIRHCGENRRGKHTTQWMPCPLRFGSTREREWRVATCPREWCHHLETPSAIIPCYLVALSETHADGSVFRCRILLLTPDCC